MIEATVNKGEVKCSIEGRWTQILAELAVLVDSILDKIVDEDEDLKKIGVDHLCELLNYIN